MKIRFILGELALLAMFVVDSSEKDLTTAVQQNHRQGEKHE
ncbi:hypothetical protein [Bradyrhizobium glycinis]|nr:hypothetical protein [Bradyrhizobium glycinis]